MEGEIYISDRLIGTTLREYASTTHERDRHMELLISPDAHQQTNFYTGLHMEGVPN